MSVRTKVATAIKKNLRNTSILVRDWLIITAGWYFIYNLFENEIYMNKLKFSFKIKELEVNIEGTREEVANMSGNIGQQLKGFMQPEQVFIAPALNQPLAVTEEGELEVVKSTQRKKRANLSGGKSEKVKALDFVNDPAVYGSPLQQWKTLEKAAWLLFVVMKIQQVSQLSAGQIAATFNKHFKQSGTIRPNNISRDLGKQKAGQKALCGEDATTVPAKWFLTDEGIRFSEKLIHGLNKV